MSKVITFSRRFPAYHPRKGEPTYFVEKFLNNVGIEYLPDTYLQKLCIWNTANLAKGKLQFDDLKKFYLSLKEIQDDKGHTIRAGERFCVGDKFSPRVWFDKPYNSPQIIFAPDTPVYRIWTFELANDEYILAGGKLNLPQLTEVAKNDGLTPDDLELWFQKPFRGQTICWSQNIKY